MPTYPTNPALEAAVIANAEDDTPRLAYADWLDENGDSGCPEPCSMFLETSRPFLNPFD